VILAVLGCAAIVGVARLLTKRGTPVGELVLSAGIPEWAPLALGCGCVVAIAVYAFRRSVRVAPRFRIDDRGLTVSDTGGDYTLEWSNIREVGVTSVGALGIRVVDRGAVVATHAGTDEQREWLRTAEPYREWDYLFDSSEMGVSGEVVCGWVGEWRPGVAQA